MSFEISLSRPITKALKDRVAVDKDDKIVHKLPVFLYDNYLLTSGFSLDESGSQVYRIFQTIKFGLGIK